MTKQELDSNMEDNYLMLEEAYVNTDISHKLIAADDPKRVYFRRRLVDLLPIYFVYQIFCQALMGDKYKKEVLDKKYPTIYLRTNGKQK